MRTEIRKGRGGPAAVFVLTCAIFLTGIAPGDAGGKGKSVLDYYLALPRDYFICELPVAATPQYRMKQIIKKNIRNGYIEARSNGFKMQVALFTDAKRKRDIVAVNVPCGPGCMCNRFAFLLPSGRGKWTDVTGKIFPSEEDILKAVGKMNEDVILQYDLPEFGLDIKVIDGKTGARLCRVTWGKGEFRIRIK